MKVNFLQISLIDLYQLKQRLLTSLSQIKMILLNGLKSGFQKGGQQPTGTTTFMRMQDK